MQRGSRWTLRAYARHRHTTQRPASMTACAVILALALGALGATCTRAPYVILHPKSGGSVSVPVELAVTPAEQQRGLMYRRDLAADAGMLFVFDETIEHSFWMKNTPLPLDMIFIGEDLRIVGIVANAVPFSTASRSVGAPSRYVLEVHAGFAERHGLHAGDRVELPPLNPSRP
jgi:uncharacterized membrane protein (UPF0127 family)